MTTDISRWAGSALRDRLLQAGRASRYIMAASEATRKGTRVVIVVRVSTSQQNHNRNLDDQLDTLRRWVADRGGVVVAEVPHVGPGSDPSWLRQAATLARQLGAVLLAESVDRFVRHPDFNPKACPDAQPREIDLQELRHCTEGVILATLLSPDATPEQIRSYQRRRGQSEKGNRGGRPRKRKCKERRLARIDLAREMRDLYGWSCQHISDALNARNDGFTDQTRMTVFNWLRRSV